MNNPVTPLAERLVKKVRQGGAHECWEFIGKARMGKRREYGAIWGGVDIGKVIGAHVAAHLVWVGPVGPGLVVHHECDNPICCNPAHLRAVTQQENITLGNGIGMQRRRASGCSKGHPWTAENTRIRYRGTCIERSCRTCEKARRPIPTRALV